MSAGLDAFQLSFQASPIILTGGSAQNLPGAMLPVIALTEALNFIGGLLSGASNIGLNEFFASYQPVAGSTLISQEIGEYPFANQAVAANAVITTPLRISMLMTCPVRETAGYATKLATMTSFQSTLAQHNAAGGTYTIATPAYFYTNCVMLNMRDVTAGESKQVQMQYQLDFEQPLLTEAQAAQALNSLMTKIDGGLPISGNPTWSGLGPTVGLPPSLAGASIIPAITSSPAGGIAQFVGSIFG